MAESPTLVRLSNVGKIYPKLATNRGRLLALWDLLSGRVYRNASVVLSNISLSIQRGQSLALVGENGAGKSTLLKLIAGVLQPSVGSVQVNARISALLELGAGFHPDYDGLENIRLAGTLLGLNPKEIAEKLPAILEFADIGEHINEPLKHYSSGMIVRLGFAVATALEPDLLITDEVLAVGDESFQRKCTTWLENYLARGGTLLLVSHNMYHVQKLCQQAVWLHNGEIRLAASSHEVVQSYLNYHEEKTQAVEQSHRESLRQSGATYSLRSMVVAVNGKVDVTEATLSDTIKITGELFSPDGRPPVVALGVVRTDGVPVYGTFSDLDQYLLTPSDEQCFSFTVLFPDLTLLPGQYWIRVHAMDPEGLRLLDTMEQTLRVIGATREMGFCRLEHRWV